MQANATRIAASGQRLGAAAVDYILLLVIYRLLFIAVPLLSKPFEMAFVVNIIVYFAYMVGISRSRYRATPGKYWFGIVVVDNATQRLLTNHRTVARAFYGLLPFVFFFYFYYVYWPYMLDDRYEYRVGTNVISQKMHAGIALTDEEKERWKDFWDNVQGPVNDMYFASLKITFVALFLSALVIITDRQKRAVHDMICQTLVIERQSIPDDEPQ